MSVAQQSALSAVSSACLNPACLSLCILPTRTKIMNTHGQGKAGTRTHAYQNTKGYPYSLSYLQQCKPIVAQTPSHCGNHSILRLSCRCTTSAAGSNMQCSSAAQANSAGPACPGWPGSLQLHLPALLQVCPHLQVSQHIPEMSAGCSAKRCEIIREGKVAGRDGPAILQVNVGDADAAAC